MTIKEEEKILGEILRLAMGKILPERVVVFKGFDGEGKQITLQRIVYKKGGFDIKSRWVNPVYKKLIN